MKRILFLSTSLLSVFSVQAQTEPDMIRYLTPVRGIGAQSMAMGYSNSLIATDNSALFLNPASLAMVKKTTLSVSLNTNQGSVASDWLGNKNEQDFSNTKINQFSVSYPYPVSKGSFVLAFGYGQTENWDQTVKGGGYNTSSSFVEGIYGFNPSDRVSRSGLENFVASKRAADLMFDWAIKSNLFQYRQVDGHPDLLRERSIVFGNVQQDYTSVSEGGMNTWSFAASSEVAEGLFAGISVHFFNGDYYNKYSYSEKDVNRYYLSVQDSGFNYINSKNENTHANFSALNFVDKLEEKITGYSVKFGLSGKLTDELSGGFSYSLPTSLTVDTKNFVDMYMQAVDSSGVPLIDVFATDEPIDYASSYNLEGASVIEANIAYAGFPFSCEAGLVTEDWTNSRITSPDDSENYDDLNDFFRFNTKRTWDFKLGVQYAVPVIQSFVRAGIYSQDSPYKEGGTRVNRLSAGYQFVSESGYTFDLGYSYNSSSETYLGYAPANKPKVTYKEDQSYSSFAVGLAIKF
ncbi:MAG: hypothetical protein L6Q77_01455 [Bacteroidetes bacterium]|nr:hypothetical protein [Bacteroidota bacterium]